MPDLRTITQQEIELLSSFVALLKKESDVLQRNEIGALSEISSEKAPLIVQLNALDARRTAFIAPNADETVATAMGRWLDKHPEDKDAAERWKTLLALAREAKQLNALNTSLTNMHLSHIGTMLDVLTQQAKKQPLYDSTGQAAQATGSRIVDSA